MSPTSTQLSAQVKVRHHYLRSAHLEHHEGQMVDGYIPTGRALEVLHRISRAMNSKDAGRAWSLTGPYGAGKSSFALFVHALFGPEGENARSSAEASLLAAEPELLAQIEDGRTAFGASRRGFIRAAATSQREPIGDTVLRAFTIGAHRYWRTRMPAIVKRSLVIAGQERTPRALSLALEAMCEHAPVLIEIDEFGKNLEHFASAPAGADLFVLQELAERCTGDHGLPALLVTLQHMAFDDYVRGASAVQRREWGKVQGRFEDISFVESAEQSLRLVAGAIEPAPARSTFRRSVHSWAAGQVEACERLGLTRLLAGGAATLESCYPLHPVTLLAIPEMCARFGQHGRTLFSFVTSREPHSVAEFLDATRVNDPLPAVGLDRLYDFFITSAAGTGSRHALRLAEIDTTIRETTGLTDDQRTVLKVIGVLNVLSRGGPLRASIPVIRYALSASRSTSDSVLRKLISELEQRGVLTYRGFADEYRLWQGSDLDLAALVEQARDELVHASPAELLDGQHSMPPAIAGKHSQRVGMLRYFATVLADSGTTSITGPTVYDAADGLLVYFLGPPEAAGALPIQSDIKPVVIATTTQYATIIEAVKELAAVLQTLERPDVQEDTVARRELQDRAADARRRLTERVSSHLHPAGAGVQFRRAGEQAPLPVGRGLSSLLSDVCDAVYSATPEIRNEMLGRRELTSQAAKARRELLTAMVEHHDREWLAMDGFGPKTAMYAALLRHTGIHRDLGDGTFGYHYPKRGSMSHTWGTMTMMMDKATNERLSLDTLYARLMAPPIGLQDGPIPVLLTALLLYRVDDVAIYQEGTYQPAITADLLERLVKSPDRFAVKHFKLTTDRTRLLQTVARVVENLNARAPSTSPRGKIANRNGTLLGVAGPLLNAVRNLPAYTTRTTTLSERARAVRDAILTAREPDELIFTQLPAACGLKGLGDKERRHPAELAMFGTNLEKGLQELNLAYAALLERCRSSLATELRLSTNELPALRAQLKSRAQPLMQTLLEPRLRSFVSLAASDDLDDDSWIDAVANNVAGRPAAGWRDEDAERFDVEMRAIGGAFRRYQALVFDTFASNETGSFDAFRISVTRPDGSEYDEVAWVDEATKARLQDALSSAFTTAEQLLGERGRAALMALLAGKVAGARQDADAPPAPATLQRKVRHA